MPITVNEGGTLYTLDTVTANEGGTLYGLDTVYSNEGGTLYEIFSSLPKSLNWNVTTSIGTAHPQAKINSTSDSGFTVTVYVQYERPQIVHQSFVYSDPVKLKAGTKISFTTSNVSGSGNIKQAPFLYLEEGTASDYISSSSAKIEPTGYTVPSDGEYHFAIGGYTYTVTGSSSGTTTTAYPVTGTVAITLSR